MFHGLGPVGKERRKVKRREVMEGNEEGGEAGRGKKEKRRAE